MGLFSRCLYCLCLSMSLVCAFPQLRNENTMLEEIYKFCETKALNEVLQNNQLPALDYSTDMRGDNVDDYYNRLTKDIVQRLNTNVMGYDLVKNDREDIQSQMLQVQEFKMILNEYTRNRKECLLDYISELNLNTETKRSQENIDTLDSDNYTDKGFKELLSLGSETNSIGTEKRQQLSLNPTGWRKRRSGTQNEAQRLQEYLTNVRQLIEKKKRLEFNPTGW